MKTIPNRYSLQRTILAGAGMILSAWAATLPAPAASEEAPGTWPQWRGAGRDSKFDGPAWPGTLDPGALRPLWRVPFGPSYSGPVASERLVFTTESKDGKYEAAAAVDRKTGQTVWTAQWEGAMTVPFFAKKNGSWIRSTPAYDGANLYMGGMLDVLVCLDAESGKELWRSDLAERFQANRPDFGFVSSPLVVGDHLYVQGGGSFLKMEKATGKVLWRSLVDGGGMMNGAFSSPVMAELEGRSVLLVQTRDNLAGVEPGTGAELWRQFIPSFRGMNILTPTVHEGSVFTSNYRGKSWKFRPVRRGEAHEVEEVWKGKTMAYMSSPVVVGDYAYLHLQSRRVCCVDLRTGKETWRTGEGFGEYWSMIAQGDRILALDETGELNLFRANPAAFEPLARRQVGESSTWAHLAMAGRSIFIRELNALTAYEWSAPAEFARLDTPHP